MKKLLCLLGIHDWHGCTCFRCGKKRDIYHIFKRFYRSRFAKDRSGIGLGLALVRSIAERHGGTVEADSTLGKGSSFSIYLPDVGKNAGGPIQQPENQIPTKM